MRDLIGLVKSIVLMGRIYRMDSFLVEAAAVFPDLNSRYSNPAGGRPEPKMFRRLQLPPARWVHTVPSCNWGTTRRRPRLYTFWRTEKVRAWHANIFGEATISGHSDAGVAACASVTITTNASRSFAHPTSTQGARLR